MRENDLTEDAFMKLLCDDLSIIYQTMDLTNGAMYALSRFTSQGRQQTYSATPKRTNQIIKEDYGKIFVFYRTFIWLEN